MYNTKPLFTEPTRKALNNLLRKSNFKPYNIQ